MEKKIEGRYPRSYKARETPYCKAVKRARKENTTLAEMIEKAVVAYSNGQEFKIHEPVVQKQSPKK